MTSVTARAFWTPEPGDDLSALELPDTSAMSKSGGRSAPDEGADARGEPAGGVLVGPLTGGGG